LLLLLFLGQLLLFPQLLLLLGFTNP
jgi:hypothetical protein